MSNSEWRIGIASDEMESREEENYSTNLGVLLERREIIFVPLDIDRSPGLGLNSAVF